MFRRMKQNQILILISLVLSLVAFSNVALAKGKSPKNEKLDNPMEPQRRVLKLNESFKIGLVSYTLKEFRHTDAPATETQKSAAVLESSENPPKTYELPWQTTPEGVTTYSELSLGGTPVRLTKAAYGISINILLPPGAASK